MKKIGLFGGTFNPIHNGHLEVAKRASSCFELDKVIFIPSGDPPHKTNEQIEKKEHRYQMTCLALAPFPEFCVSDYELTKESLSYSLETVSYFAAKHPNDRLFFILGADSFHDIPTWWHYRQFIEICNFIVISRPDTEKEALLNLFAGDETPPRLFFIDDVYMDISSTNIREELRNGREIDELVPASVCEYIKKHNIYTEG